MEGTNHKKCRNLISKRTTCEKSNLSATTLWRKVKKGEFPAPVQISSRRVAWYEAEVDEHNANLPRVGGMA